MFDDLPIELLLLLKRSRVADRELNHDQVIGTPDAEIVRVVDEVVFVVLADRHEAVAFRNVEGFAHRKVKAFEDGLAVSGWLAPPQ